MNPVNWTRKSYKRPFVPLCACWTTLLSTTTTAYRKHVTPTWCTALSDLALWVFRMHCINCVYPMLLKRLSSLLMNQWKQSAITPLMLHQIWPQSVANINPTKAACGAKAFCRLTPSKSSKKRVVITCNRMKVKPWIGMPFATKSNVRACVTPTRWPLHRQQPFPISVASVSRLNRPIRTCL